MGKIQIDGKVIPERSSRDRFTIETESGFQTFSRKYFRPEQESRLYLIVNNE